MKATTELGAVSRKNDFRSSRARDAAAWQAVRWRHVLSLSRRSRRDRQIRRANPGTRQRSSALNRAPSTNSVRDSIRVPRPTRRLLRSIPRAPNSTNRGRAGTLANALRVRISNARHQKREPHGRGRRQIDRDAVTYPVSPFRVTIRGYLPARRTVRAAASCHEQFFPSPTAEYVVRVNVSGGVARGSKTVAVSGRTVSAYLLIRTRHRHRTRHRPGGGETPPRPTAPTKTPTRKPIIVKGGGERPRPTEVSAAFVAAGEGPYEDLIKRWSGRARRNGKE